jgi:hypothetical protein
MAIGIYFHPESMSAKQYDEVTRRLDAAGVGRPKGRLHHSAFGPENALMVYDVWESQETFDEFGKTLMPILKDLGVDPGQPDIVPVHNMIQ